MSSIIIKGMDMPQKCSKCPIADISAEYFYCVKIDWFGKQRPHDCPLAEIPTPHGRLVDIDDAIESYGGNAELEYVSQAKFLNVIIEAEREG